MQELNRIDGIKIPFIDTPHFMEFVLNFDETGMTVADINEALLGYEIFAGVDLSLEFPELGQSALYCFTEVHNKASIDRLVNALKEIVAK